MSDEVRSEHVQTMLPRIMTRSCQEISGLVRSHRDRSSEGEIRSGQVWSGKGQDKSFLVILGEISSR